MPEIVPIRKRNHLDADINLEKIRDAVDHVFQTLLEWPLKQRITPFDDEAKKDFVAKLFGKQYKPEEFEKLIADDVISEQINEAYEMYVKFDIKCIEATEIILSFLLQNYFGEFDLYVGTCHYNLNFFHSHTVAILRSKSTGLFYCISPANIFTRAFLTLNGGFINPHYKNQFFDRMTSVITGSSIEEIFQVIAEIEGGEGYWEARKF